jgi:hypothetical protein
MVAVGFPTFLEPFKNGKEYFIAKFQLLKECIGKE